MMAEVMPDERMELEVHIMGSIFKLYFKFLRWLPRRLHRAAYPHHYWTWKDIHAAKIRARKLSIWLGWNE